MTTRPSRTAAAIAAGRAIGLAGLHDPLAHRFLPAPQRPVVAAMRRTLEASTASEVVVNTLTAGLAGHAALRMAAVDRAVNDAVADGCRQVVVVGAGFDTRAWRLPAVAECHVVEVDLPAIQEVKRHRLAEVPAVAADVEFAPADLSRDVLGDVLGTTAHQPRLPTAWVWEAVAPYLPRAAVADTVTAIARLSAAGSHLAMTVAHPDLLGGGTIAEMLSPAARGLFAGIGEPLRSTFDDEAITDLLVEHGFRSVAISDSSDWARRRGRARGPDPWAAERLVTASR